MSEAQASVVLSPISPLGPESSITRSFTLSSRNPVFEIGRSSKREVKNRTPAKDNGWFDSRVMSRDHAELGFNMDKEKMIYIRDFGSTHGTWLNNVKLITGEDTPLLSGDILRFGVDVDRGDEEFPALSVRCNVTWSESTPTTDLDIYSCDPSDMLYNHTPEPAPTTFESKPASELRPSSSTNTFCVPDDDESDVGETKVNQISPFKVGEGDITVLYEERSQENYQVSRGQELSMNSGPYDSGCEEVFPIEDSHEEYSDSSNGEDSEFDSDPSSFSQVSDDDDDDDDEETDHLDYLNLPIPISDDDNSDSEDDSDVESVVLYDDECSVGQVEDEEECIDPSMLAHDENAAPPSLEEAIQKFTPAGVIPKPHFKVEVEEQVPCPMHHQHIIFPTHFPLTPITPVLDHKRDEDDGSQRLGRLSIRDVLNNYQDGPFVGPSDATSKDASLEEEVVAEFSSPTSLKRKAFEMESQDAQILESTVPPSENLDLETISQSEVADAISSALSETSDGERPNKRVKAAHDASNHLASYTATAVISALLGGLGTIALLASLPAEYFQ